MYLYNKKKLWLKHIKCFGLKFFFLFIIMNTPGLEIFKNVFNFPKNKNNFYN